MKKTKGLRVGAEMFCSVSESLGPSSSPQPQPQAIPQTCYLPGSWKCLGSQSLTEMISKDTFCTQIL